MKARLWGIVQTITAERGDVQELRVQAGEQTRTALNYSVLTGRVVVGERVLLNTWAGELGLGTGGVDFVAAVLPEDREASCENAEPPGHLMKLRYTPLQIPVLAAEAPESPHHTTLSAFTTLNKTPVVCAELHSQIAAIAVAAKHIRPQGRIAYIMTDGAALPLAFSRLVPMLRTKGFLDATVTAGQAFGGDYEAINVYSALTVAKMVARADLIIVGQGPGNAGTGTPLGFSGLEQGIALNATLALDGTPILTVRWSDADPRERHRGMSHHTRTVLERIVLGGVHVPLPADGFPFPPANLPERHTLYRVEAESAWQALAESGITVTTMGRTLTQDPAFFLASAAAGVHAANLLPE